VLQVHGIGEGEASSNLNGDLLPCYKKTPQVGAPWFFFFMKLSRPRASAVGVSYFPENLAAIVHFFREIPPKQARVFRLFGGLFRFSHSLGSEHITLSPAPAKCSRSAAYRRSHCHAVPHPAACYRPRHPRPPSRRFHGQASAPGAGRRPATSARGARTVPAPPATSMSRLLTPVRPRRWRRWGRSCCPPPTPSPRHGAPTPPSPGGPPGSPSARRRPPTTPPGPISPSWYTLSATRAPPPSDPRLRLRRFVEQVAMGDRALPLSCAGDAEGDYHAQGDGGAAQRVHAAQPGARRAQRHRPRMGHRRAVRAAQ
jgi:hypothetical protein